MVQFIIEALVVDVRTGEEKRIVHLTGATGKVQELMEELAMQDCLLHARVDGQRVAKLVRITATIERFIYPEHFSELTNL